MQEEIGVSSQRAGGKFGHSPGGVRGGASREERRRDQTDRQTDPGPEVTCHSADRWVDVPSDDECIGVMEGLGTNPDHLWRDGTHKCVQAHTYTHRERNTEKEQNSTSFQKDREGTGGESNRRTCMYTQPHTHAEQE